MKFKGRFKHDQSMSQRSKALQLTLAIIKPDLAVQPYLVKEIHNLMLSNKFLVIRSQSLRLTRIRAEVFYQEHKGKFFFDRLVNYMLSGPIRTYVLAKENAIADWRSLMGPTKVFRTIHSHPESIRGRFGLTDTRNSTHGSDSDASAEREISFFFQDFDYKAWYETEELKFRQGPVRLDTEAFMHRLDSGFGET